MALTDREGRILLHILMHLDSMVQNGCPCQFLLFDFFLPGTPGKVLRVFNTETPQVQRAAETWNLSVFHPLMNFIF